MIVHVVRTDSQSSPALGRVLVERHINLSTLKMRALFPRRMPRCPVAIRREHLYLTPAPLRVDVAWRRTEIRIATFGICSTSVSGEVLYCLASAGRAKSKVSRRDALAGGVRAPGVKDIDPAALTFDQRLVIVVRVADEDVVFVIREINPQPASEYGRREGRCDFANLYHKSARVSALGLPETNTRRPPIRWNRRPF
jgi:hypothetical protein